MKKSDNEKLDTIITMLADIVDVFGKRFDNLDENAAAGEKKLTHHIDGVKSKVDEYAPGRFTLVRISALRWHARLVTKGKRFSATGMYPEEAAARLWRSAHR